MFALYKKELQSYFLSPIAYFVIAFFMATFSLTFIQDIGNVSSSTYTFSFPSIFYVNIFYFIFLLPLLTMRTFSEERKNGTETLLLSSPLNVTQIVMAKFLATATILLMMLVVSLFYPILTSIYGRVIWSSHLYLHRILPVRSGLHRTGHLHLVSDGNAAAGNPYERACHAPADADGQSECKLVPLQHSGAVRCAELVLQSDEVLCILPGTDAILRSAGLFH